MHCWNWASISGSSPEVGSSSSNSSAFDANAATRATFCRLPLEYVRAFLRGSRSNRSSNSSRRPRSRPPRIRPSRSITSPPVMVGHSVTSPGTYASRRCRATASRHGSCPSIRTVPASGRSSPSRTRIVVVLPLPFGPEETVHLTGLDGQVESVQRDGRAEGLGQAGDLDRRPVQCVHVDAPHRTREDWGYRAADSISRSLRGYFMGCRRAGEYHTVSAAAAFDGGSGTYMR